MEEVWIFANPIAGRGRCRLIAENLQSALRSGGYDSRLFLERADRLGDDQLTGRPRAAIVIGGDGTIRGVAQRLYLSPRGAVPAPPLLPIPLGTANLLSRHLGIRRGDALRPEWVVKTLGQYRIWLLDAAMANGQLCLMMAHVGFDAQVVHELARIRRGPIRYASYVLPALRSMVSYHFPSLSVRVDGRAILTDRPALAFIANIPEYGAGFSLVPSAAGNDGVLDVCVVGCRDHYELLDLMLRAAGGSHIRSSKTILARGRVIEVTARPAAPVQVDGEAAGTSPLVVRIAPQRIAFVVPKAAYTSSPVSV